VPKIVKIRLKLLKLFTEDCRPKSFLPETVYIEIRRVSKSDKHLGNPWITYIKPIKRQLLFGWLGGSVVRALARDRKVASSTPGQSATKQQLWASCSHPCAVSGR